MSKPLKARKDQILFIALGTAAAIAGLWYVLLSGQYQTLAAAQKKSGDMRDKVTRAENVLKRVPEIEQELERKGQELGEIEDTMASGDMYSRTLNTLNQFIRNYVVSFNTSDLSREVVSDVRLFPKFPYQAATFVVRVSSYYHDFGVFLADFENNFPYARVQNLELTPGGSAFGDPEKLECKFEIVMLIKPGSS